MVATDQINLIEEFTLNQKNNNYIILTSFCFDPIFFDNFLLPKIRTNNPFAEIIILIDAGQYANSLEHFTDQTGRIYQLIPIYLNNGGVFHPKLFTFISTTEQKITIYVASSNITLSGFTKNAELVFKYDAIKENFDVNIGVIKQFYEKLISNEFIRDEKAKRTLSQVIDFLSTGNIETKNVRLLHNIDFSILSQILQEISPESIYECFLFAPFFSPNTKLLESICEKINLKKIRIGIQKNNHNLTDPDLYLSFCKKNGLECEILETQYADDDSRIFHSKVLHFKGKTNYLLIGSPNLTQRALMNKADQGNIEFAVFLNKKNVESIIDQFSLTKLGDPSRLPSFIDSFEPNDFSLQLRIFSVCYEHLSKKIHVITESLQETAIVKIFFDDKRDCFTQHIALHTGKFSVSITNMGIPVEVKIICNEKFGVRRIYYDRGYFFRNVSQSNFSVHEISNLLFQDNNIDNSEMQVIILILIKNQINSDAISEDMAHQEFQTNFEKKQPLTPLRPSRIPTSNDFQDFFYDVDKISLMLKSKKEQEKNYDNINTAENEDFFGSCIDNQKNPNSKVAHKKLNAAIKKLHKKLDYLFHSAECRYSKDEIVHLQAIFLLFLLRNSIDEINQSQIENIETMLNHNLDKINRNEITQESSIHLFKNLLLINYYHDCHYHSKILRSTISYVDFLVPKVYFEIKNFIINLHKQHLINNSEFDLNKFRYQFCSLVTFCFNPSTISKGPLEVIQAMTNTDNSELVDFYGNILLKLKSGPWNNPYSTFSLNTPRKNIRELYNDLDIQNDTAKKYILEFIN
ncbi:hypothetical protein MSKOL_1432 [Methanosarcina sp. Kolksee]|uniref:phospholipase D-like domain-containing protein n=1 Tax=Methanosarcina sp. Kolksee TaxID=1434099 RepID=UPI0006158517|nr:phospholipase D-like domain-containing protein [Methanosarcina sp. Kolksee]AKB47209.1 hypothetical protein MSKOL_1432 [Methanosarcina sp. Kolksee]